MNYEQVIPPALRDRHAIPNRRISETRKVVTLDGASVYLTIGYDPNEPLRPREVFYSSGLRSGSQLEFQVQDICVLLSLMLQYGFASSQLVKSLAKREKPDRSAEYASVTGLITHQLTLPPSWSEPVETHE